MAVGVPLGPYRLVRRLATGGMAEIFLARQEGPDGFARELVVKRILPHLAADPEFTRMFRDEAKLAALLSHPNAVHVYDFGAVEDAGGNTLYLAMELVRGVDLRALILRALTEAKRVGRPGAIPVHHAVKICSFVCEALAHAHSVRIDGKPAGIVHRDVTPSNVLVSFDGAVKLADFGIAKAATTATDRTEHGIIKGKHTYLSPEQARGDALDARSDLFNVGILVFESVLGEALFPPSDQRLARRLSARGEIPRPERFERVPPGLAKIALKALSAERADRYPDALALRADLEAFLRTCPEPSDTVELGRFVRQMCAEELSEDALGPRAAGTVASKRQGRSTAQLTGPTGSPAPRAPTSTQPLSAVAPGSSARPPPTQASARASGRALAAAQLPSTTQPLAEAVTTDPTATALTDGSTEAALSAAGSGVFTHTGATGLTPSDASALVPAPPTGVMASEAPAPLRTSNAPPAAQTTPIVRGRRGSWTGPAIAASIVAVALVLAVLLVTGTGDEADDLVSLPRTASVSVSSEPPGARLFVDGVEHGVTPSEIATIMPGRAVRLEVRDATGRVLDAQELSLAEGERREVALRATPPSGRVRVSSEPSGAAVSIDGREAGTTPLEVDVSIGEHRVRVALAGHAIENDVVRVERAGDRASLSFSLRQERARPTVASSTSPREATPRPPAARGGEERAPARAASGTLRVATTPWSVVFEGSRRLGETPLQVELPAGRHVLTLRASDRPPQTETVEIREGEVTRVRVIL